MVTLMEPLGYRCKKEKGVKSDSDTSAFGAAASGEGRST